MSLKYLEMSRNVLKNVLKKHILKSPWIVLKGLEKRLEENKPYYVIIKEILI